MKTINGKALDEWIEELKRDEEIPETVRSRRQFSVSLDKENFVLSSLLIWKKGRGPSELLKEMLEEFAEREGIRIEQ